MFLIKVLTFILSKRIVFQFAYFDRDDVALHGFSHFFKEMSEEESEHARNLMKYQNMRGGRVVFQDVAKPPAEDWKSALNAVQTALDLEKKVNAVTAFAKLDHFFLAVWCCFLKEHVKLPLIMLPIVLVS